MKNEERLEHKRHSLAHLLAAAVLELYPDAKPTIGPAIDTGFYYDFDGLSISDKELPVIEKKMRELVKHWELFEKIDVSADEAKEIFAGNPYKLELIEELNKLGEEITLYYSGPKKPIPSKSDFLKAKSYKLEAYSFLDLCRGGHAENPSKDIVPSSWKLSRVAGAYWRGDEKNAMLTRIYGFAFNTKDELEAYEKQLEEAKKRDHKKLGPELDLFFIDEKVGKGLPMWTPKGTAIKMELENFTRELERRYGYEHVSTPYLGSEELYRTSGHLDHYRQNMYAPIDMDGDVFYLRPMACPHHIRMYQRKPWSYKELPARYAEIADYNRYEKSGELMGMIRVRKFQLTDAHIFVAPEGLKEEFKSVLSLIKDGMAGLGLSEIVTYRFSKRDPNNKEKYFSDDTLWNRAESVMKEALDESDFTYTEAEDEAAFYGPKLDVQARNVNGKEDTLFTAQIDFLLPEKFNIEYTAADGTKKRPVMIHRSAIGCLERTFAFLIEHYAGAFPLWLSPVQVVVLPVSEKHEGAAREALAALQNSGIRAEMSDPNESLGKRVREVKMQKIPYWLVIGDKEAESNSAALEGRNSKTAEQLSVDEIVKMFKKEISDRK